MEHRTRISNPSCSLGTGACTLRRGQKKKESSQQSGLWGIRCTTHKFHFRTRQFDRLKIHLQRQFRKETRTKENMKGICRGYKGYSGRKWTGEGRGSRQGSVSESRQSSHQTGPKKSHANQHCGLLSRTAREELRLVASIEVGVGLVPVTGGGHRLATTVTTGIALGKALTGHARPSKVVCLLIPASASRGRTCPVRNRTSELKLRILTLVHGGCRTAILREEAGAVVESSSIGLRGEVVELTRRRSIFTPLLQLVKNMKL